MRKLFVLGIAIAILTSCQKEDDSGESRINYTPLEIGNYWIYQHYSIDSIGNETETTMIDSVVITKDTIINGNKYFILEGTNKPLNGGKWVVIDILRDSLGYLINNKGQIQFAENNFSDTLAKRVMVNNHNGDTIYTLTYKMEKPNNSVTIPAGTFDVLNYKGTVITVYDIPGVKNPRYINKFYSDKVGKILDTYFYIHGPLIYEKRLLRYYIQE